MEHLQHLGEFRNRNQWKQFHLSMEDTSLYLVKQDIVYSDNIPVSANENEVPVFPKYEILLRGEKNGSPLNLGAFLQQVENDNFEFNLDIVLLERTFQQIAEDYQGNPEYDDTKFSINVYPATFCDRYFSEFISYLVEKTKVRTENIILELLESGRSCESFCNMGAKQGCNCEINRNIGFLEREYGINTAIDDYGNGNNNTQLLERLRGFKIVKLDGDVLERKHAELGTDGFLLLASEVMKHLKSKGVQEITFEKVDSWEKVALYQRVDSLGMKVSYQGWLFDKSSKL